VVSPGDYGLRLSFKPTYIADVVTGSVRVVNLTGVSAITAVYSRIFNSDGITPP
jgi:hypothetical protein